MPSLYSSTRRLSLTTLFRSPLITEIAMALRAPVWAPYLGRRSCPPDTPFLLADGVADPVRELERRPRYGAQDRKSTRLNSSHLGISYAVFCLKTKKTECTTR